MAKFTPTTAYAERLASTISASSTKIRVSSVLDRDGVALPISATNKGYFTLEPGTSREESIVCTGVNTVTNELTGCVRGLAASGSGETGSSARAYSHNAGTKIVMTDIAQFFGNFVNATDPEADAGYTPTDDKNLTTKEWVENRNGYWEGAVADYAALSLITTDNDGAARVTLDDSKLYVWSDSTNSWNLAGAGGGAGTVYITTKLGTEAEGDDNKTFQLNTGSFPDKKYLQVYKNGVLQEEGSGNDYVATGSNQAVFEDVVQDDDVITLLVVSVDLYNPAWNSVNADILPDVDATHDIGSTTKKFKDLHLSGSVYGDGSKLTGINTFGIFGDGSDGDVTISTNTSLVRDMYYDNLTINDTIVLNPNGYKIFVKGTTTFLGTGKIASDGNNGGNGQNGAGPSGSTPQGGTAGAAAYSTGTLPIPKAGSAGGNGGLSTSNGSAGATINALLSIGTTGAAGGDGSSKIGSYGGNGGAGGAAGTITNAIQKPRTLSQAMNLFDINGTAIALFTGTAGSGSGGGGGGWYNNVSVAWYGAGGGGSGSAGGVVFLFSNKIITVDGNDYITAIGGNGGNGGNAYDTGNPASASTGAGGGGGGGSGGVVILAFDKLTGTGTINVSGGTGGTKGTGGSGSPANGNNGNTGVIYTIIN